MSKDQVRVWARGGIAAFISGLMGGVLNGAAVMGISPEHFNLQDPHKLAVMVAYSAAVTGALGLAMYLRQSPLPPE